MRKQRAVKTVRHSNKPEALAQYPHNNYAHSKTLTSQLVIIQFSMQHVMHCHTLLRHFLK